MEFDPALWKVDIQESINPSNSSKRHKPGLISVERNANRLRNITSTA